MVKSASVCVFYLYFIIKTINMLAAVSFRRTLLVVYKEKVTA